MADGHDWAALNEVICMRCGCVQTMLKLPDDEVCQGFRRNGILYLRRPPPCESAMLDPRIFDDSPIRRRR